MKELLDRTGSMNITCPHEDDEGARCGLRCRYTGEIVDARRRFPTAVANGVLQKVTPFLGRFRCPKGHEFLKGRKLEA